MSFYQPPRPGHHLLVSRRLAGAWQPDTRPPSEPISSGLDDLDRIRALQPGRATLVTGPAGVGTSALVLSIALHVATHHAGSVLYVTDHLDGDEVEQRLVALEGRIDLNRPNKHVDQQALRQQRLDTLESLSRLPIAILACDEGVTPRRIAECARELERAGTPLRLLIIDRISMLRASPGGSRETATLVAELLNLVDDRSVTTILVEEPSSGASVVRPGAVPRVPTAEVSPIFVSLRTRLSSVLWLHRAEMFDEGTPDRGIGEIHVLWQRQGATGVIRAAFLPHLTRWANLARHPTRDSSHGGHGRNDGGADPNRESMERP